MPSRGVAGGAGGSGGGPPPPPSSESDGPDEESGLPNRSAGTSIKVGMASNGMNAVEPLAKVSAGVSIRMPVALNKRFRRLNWGSGTSPIVPSTERRAQPLW